MQQQPGRPQPARRQAAGVEGSRVERRSAPAAPLALTAATHRASTLCDRGAVTTSCSITDPRGFPLRSLLRSAHRYNPPKSVMGLALLASPNGSTASQTRIVGRAAEDGRRPASRHRPLHQASHQEDVRGHEVSCQRTHDAREESISNRPIVARCVLKAVFVLLPLTATTQPGHLSAPTPTLVVR
eukprot:COSAG01_NODE_21515_length_898_cov_4.133917_2_plen_184_part_01